MRDTLWLAVLVLLIQDSPILLSSSSVMTGDSLLWPADVVQAEGLDATFLCQLPVTNSAGSSMEWMINGTSLHNVNVGEGLIRKEGRGNETEAIIISALPKFNGTSVTCTLYIMEPNGTVNFLESPLVTLTVQGKLEAVSDLTTKSTSSFIYLTWQPPFTLNLTTTEPDIVYLVDFVRLVNMDGGQNGESLISNISTFESYYNVSHERPDPGDVFQFTVTPRSNVEGARNGTPSQINASFSFEKPQILPTESVYTEVRFQGDQAVTVTINLTGDDLLYSPRRPETYEISLNLITKNEYEYQQEASFTVHPIVCGKLANEYIVLILNNGKIQPNHIYVVTINASNSAGSSIIVQNLIISAHYIQNINVTSSDMKHGQINIGCKFLLNSSLAMGYLAIVYSQDRGVHYLITENSDEEYITSMLTGLNAAEYSVLLYTINETGLPLKQPAGLPQTILIDNQLDYSGSGDTPQPLLNVSAAVLQNETNICLQCVFHDDSASACVLIFFTFVNTHYNNLTFLNVWKTDRVEQKAYDCIQIPNLDGIPGHVAVFAYSHEKNMIYGQPLNVSEIKEKIDEEESTDSPILETLEPTENVPNMTTIYIIIIPLTAVAATLCILLLIAVIKAVLQRRKISNRLQIMEPNIYATNTPCIEMDANTVIYCEVHNIKDKQTETAPPDDLTKVIYSEVQPSESTGNIFRIETSPPTIHHEELSQKNELLTVESVTAKLIPIVSKWKEIGEALQFNEDHLDEIFTNNETDEDCLQAMLEHYFKNSNYDHSWEEIDRAIKMAKKKGNDVDGVTMDSGNESDNIENPKVLRLLTEKTSATQDSSHGAVRN